MRHLVFGGCTGGAIRTEVAGAMRDLLQLTNGTIIVTAPNRFLHKTCMFINRRIDLLPAIAATAISWSGRTVQTGLIRPLTSFARYGRSK